MAAVPNDLINDLFGDPDVPSPSESVLEEAYKIFDSNEPYKELDLSLQIIEQPCCSPIQYRTEYLPPSKRREPLKNKNPASSYNGPAVCIPFQYLDSTEQYYIGVSLATLVHEKTSCRYLHPYELESIDHKDRNDQYNNIVWFPIESDDPIGVKSFSDLRIVRKTEHELKNYGNLRPFPGCNSNLLNNVVQGPISIRNIVPEYSLRKAQLTFTIGKKTNVTDEFPTILDPNSTIFSDEMTLVNDVETNEEKKPTKSAVKSNPSPPPDCHMRKYAPRYGYIEGKEEMLILYSEKLQVRKYGNLQITFQSNTSNIDWLAEIPSADIEVEDKMVSFKIPSFPFTINALNPVKIIVKQEGRIFEPLIYSYIPKPQYLTCQANAMNIPTPLARSNSNKRTKSSLSPFDDEETDAVVPVSENKPVLQQSKSVPESNRLNSTSSLSVNTNQTNSADNQFCDKLNDSIGLLFTNNDFKQLFRICRLFIRKRPELLHGAISKNYSDLVSKFVPVAGNDLLQQKNQLGETGLLHATRLNRVNIVKAVLEREKSDELLEDTNDKKQNIFHILALSTDSDELLDLLIGHLHKNSIDITEKFDHVDQDSNTPLQLAISNNNLSAARHFLKYFNKNVCEISDHTGDNLVHLAVRHSDLTMLKYLLDEGQLMVQGNQSNSTMTPMELARSIERDDMVRYFEEIYPPPVINEDESSDTD